MDERKYQIFVSSTYEDLKDAREKTIKTILKLYHLPIAMEMFSADDDEQWEIIKDTIDASDYYVLIIGHRYGSLTAEGISYTEKEYDYAKSINLPILAFIRNRNVATQPSERDNQDKKLNKFIAKAQKCKMCDFWENNDDLSAKVAIALPKIFRKTPQVGWIRADKATSPKVSEELASLSRENRELRIENSTLKKQINNKKPSITINFNGDDKLQLAFIKKDDIELNFHGRKVKYKEIDYPEKISIESIPEHLKKYFVYFSTENLNSSETDFNLPLLLTHPPLSIKNYNENLPSKEEIDKYNRKREISFRVIGSAINLVIDIKNIGTSKANEIFIDITFPEQVLIFKREENKHFEIPEIPIPENPIKKAEKLFKEDQKLKKYNNFSTLDIPTMLPFNHINSPFQSLQKSIQNLESKEIEAKQIDNTLIIKIKSLLHTRSLSIDDFCIIPIETGLFNISSSIVCEEYNEENNITIPVQVK